ncbi:MAG: hypothetical protein HY328_15135 [Chloroflexi bacterium]|nr:hypothetical protein [Chloroflexota bacterium]
MTRYLLAAEADKIQDFIFRSSRLREVVGASQLLSRFCQEGIVPLREQYSGQEIVNDGGSFRILFEGGDEKEVKNWAKEFGADLAELYQLALGGSLSVGEPALWNGSFQQANEQAVKNLHRAKEHRQEALADPHMPYVAYCASCGVGLGKEHSLLPGEKDNESETEERKRYLCSVCMTKAQERWSNRQSMLGKFLLAILGDERNIEGYTPIKTPEMAAAYDPRGRNYVAYLVADGNGMGKIFRKCNEEQIKRLSAELPQIVRKSLAMATDYLMARLKRQEYDNKEIVPALPLILGGDDVFVLIPAPYALDFARRFCLAFEEGMKQLLTEDTVFEELKDLRPTMAAAVVICKSKYPYALAHRRGDELLKEAKRMCKQLAADYGEYRSAVNFEVILGNRLTGQLEGEGEKAVRPRLRPYWVATDANPLSPNAQEYAIDLERVLVQRLALKDVPNKRLHELRTAFAEIPNDIENEQLAAWEKSLQRPFVRSGHKKKLWAAMHELGQTPPADGNSHHWREKKHKGISPLAHGLPDLLEVWDFAQGLDNNLSAYEPQEAEEEEE